MIVHVAEILDLPVDNGGRPSPEAVAEIARIAEKQLRLPMLGIPHWRSTG
jgi:hypothetical protein